MSLTVHWHVAQQIHIYHRLGGTSYGWGNDISCSFINEKETRIVQSSCKEYLHSSKKPVTGISEEEKGREVWNLAPIEPRGIIVGKFKSRTPLWDGYRLFW